MKHVKTLKIIGFLAFSLSVPPAFFLLRNAESLLDDGSITSEHDLPRDKDIISFIKRNRRVDFRQWFGPDWEAICFSGEYQHPVRDINYKLGKDFKSCSGRFKELRDDGLQAITIVWPKACRVIEVETYDFEVEFQNGSDCTRRSELTPFVIGPGRYGSMLKQTKD